MINQTKMMGRLAAPLLGSLVIAVWQAASASTPGNNPLPTAAALPTAFRPSKDLADFAAHFARNGLLTSKTIYLRNDYVGPITVFFYDPIGDQRWEAVPIGGGQDGELATAGIWLAVGTTPAEKQLPSIAGFVPPNDKESLNWSGYNIRLLHRLSRYEICWDASSPRWAVQLIARDGLCSSGGG